MLNPGPIAQPCINSTNGIARAHQTRSVHEKDRQIIARRVEDPVNMKKRIKRVGNLAGLSYSRL